MTGGDAQMRADIATYGWHVIKVLEDDEGPAFAFTIGLFQRFEHPELIVFGLPLETMHLMLNGAGAAVRAGGAYTAGQSYDDILEGYSCTFRLVPRRHYEAYLGSASWYYEGDDFPVLQLIWPDREHRYPWAFQTMPGYAGRSPFSPMTERSGSRGVLSNPRMQPTGRGGPARRSGAGLPEAR